MRLARGSVVRIDLLAEHHPAQGTTRFALLVERQAGWKRAVVEQCLIRRAVVLVREVLRGLVSAEVDAGVKPGPGQDRRQLRRGVFIRRAERRDVLGVELVDAPEAAKLPLDAIEVSVMITVPADEAIAADPIEDRNALDDVDRER